MPQMWKSTGLTAREIRQLHGLFPISAMSLYQKMNKVSLQSDWISDLISAISTLSFSSHSSRVVA